MICLGERCESDQPQDLIWAEEGGYLPAPWGPCTPTTRGGHIVSLFHELLWRASCDRTKPAVCWTIAPPGICAVAVIMACNVNVYLDSPMKMIARSSDCWRLRECGLLSNRCQTQRITRYFIWCRPTAGDAAVSKRILISATNAEIGDSFTPHNSVPFFRDQHDGHLLSVTPVLFFSTFSFRLKLRSFEKAEESFYKHPCKVHE